MPDTKGSMEDILILVIRYAEDQVSVENVEEFLKSKELRTELNKAFSEIAASVLKHGMLPDAEQKIEAEAISKLPAAVGSGYGDHAKAIWESKYKKPVGKEVAEIKESIDRSLRATLGPGIYILKGAVYVVVSLAAATVVYNRHMILSKAQEVCRPENQLLCTAVTKLAVLDYAKTKEIGEIKLDGSGKLSFSPSFTEMKTEFVGNIAFRRAKLTLKSDLVFDVSNRGEKLKTSDSGVQFTQQLDKGWTVGGKLNYKTDAEKGDKLDLTVNFGNESKERKVNFEFGVANVTNRPDYFVKANLTILNF
jgi:hypothetical protein